MKTKIKNITLLISSLLFILTGISATGRCSGDIYLVLLWNQVYHSFPKALVSSTTINCYYNTSAALKYYPGVHIAINLPQSVMEEFDKYKVETGTTSQQGERKNRIKELVATCREYQEKGLVEVSMTALYNPVLPLACNSQLAGKAIPDIVLPETPFTFPQDARTLLFKSMAFYKKVFNQYPAGFFPEEGAMSQEAAIIVSETGIKWVVAARQSLLRSLAGAMSDTDSEDPISRLIKPYLKPEDFYKPYFLTEKNVMVFFADDELSKGAGDIIAGKTGNAVDWLINSLHEIGNDWKGDSPPVVTVVLDSARVWKDIREGEKFVSRLYQQLSSDGQIKTITPSEYLDLFLNATGRDEDVPETNRLKELFPGTWADTGFNAWIGDEEKNRAWDYLVKTRQAIEAYKDSGKAEIEKLDKAFNNIYAAESGDWFWWYGSGNDSGRDAVYDQLFRYLLIDTYKYIDEEPPAEFYDPVTGQPKGTTTRQVAGVLTPVLDGVVTEGEWDSAGCCIDFNKGGIFDKLYYGYDNNNLYFRIDSRQNLTAQVGSDLFIAFYLGSTSGEKRNIFTRFGERNYQKTLGYGLSNEAALWFDKSDKAVLSSADGDNQWQPVTGLYNIKFTENVLELAVPFKYLNVFPSGKLMFSAVAAKGAKEFDIIPSSGPVEITIQGITTGPEILRAEDPAGDATGPGWFTYPTGAIFKPDYFDLLLFLIKEDSGNIIIELQLGLIENMLNTPLGLGPQLIDVYIDLNNRLGAGDMELLPGRNAYTVDRDAWEYAVTINGWKQELYKAGSDGPIKLADLKAEVLGNTVRIYLTKGLIRGEPGNWGWIPAMFCQDFSNYNEGILPPEDTGKISPIMPVSDEYHFGGAIEGVVNTNVLDVILPVGKCQPCILKAYKTGGAVQLPAVK